MKTENIPSVDGAKKNNKFTVQDILPQVSADRIRQNLFYLCRDPLPFRKVNYTRPGQLVNSLEEADKFINGQLKSAGYKISTSTHRVQPFRCDNTKPLHHRYSEPYPDDPWYNAANLEVTLTGYEKPDEIIQLISHKDSMSWIDSPGAHDNAVGTVVSMELARILAAYPMRRSVRFLFCNEEHTPWTSRFAADAAAERGDDIIAVMNLDSLDGKSDEDMAAHKLTHVICYSTAEGHVLAEFIKSCAARYNIELEVRTAYKQFVNDDDGMFIKAGFRSSNMHLGSWPYADSEYHLPGDVPERVNIENIVRSTQLLLAAILELNE
jgi:hypothetical protein